MSDTIFKGCGTALLTPFKEDLSIDYDAYARLVERQVEGGVDFLVPLGTSAETPTLSREEKRKILSTTREHAHGRALLVGCGSNSVDATLENMELLEDADAFLVVVPFYNKPTQEGIYLYYKALAEKSRKPIIMYNVPGRTGVNMSASTALRVAREVEGVIGVKEASGNFEQVKEILDGAPERRRRHDLRPYRSRCRGSDFRGFERSAFCRKRNGPPRARRPHGRGQVTERAAVPSLQGLLRRIEPHPREGGFMPIRPLL